MIFHFLKSCLKCHITCGVNKTDRPNRVPTVCAICTFAVYFLVFRPFCRLILVYEGHFVLCYNEKIELLDRTKANLRGHRSV